MVYFWIAITLVNVIYGFQKRKSRLIIAASFLLMIMVMAGNTEGPDLNSYMSMYKYAISRDWSDYGYGLIQWLFSSCFHTSFYCFRIMVSGICFYLIYSTMKYFDINMHFALAMYMSYLFFMDTIQIRNFIGMSIFIFSIKYLVQDGKKNVIKYIICSFIATLFHVTFLANLIFLVYRLKNKKIINRIIIVAGIAAFVFFYYNRNNSFFAMIMRFLLDDRRGQSYLSKRTGSAAFGVLIVYIFDLFLFARGYLYRSNKDNLSQKNKDYMDYMWKINCCLALFCPLLLYNISFYRFIRNVCILKYIGFEINLDSYSRNSAKRWALLFLTATSIVLWHILDYSLLNLYEETVTPIFEHNIFFGPDRMESIGEIFFV